MKWNFRKPMAVFTPKSLLRHPKVVSTKESLANGSFQEVLDDTVDKRKSRPWCFVGKNFIMIYWNAVKITVEMM